jgi:hypothetical protein
MSLFPDVTVGGVFADDLEAVAAGGGVARAPKNDKMLFCALISSYALILLACNKLFKAQTRIAQAAFAAVIIMISFSIHRLCC